MIDNKIKNWSYFRNNQRTSDRIT